MAVLDILKKMFADGGESVAPDGRPMVSPLEQFLAKSGLSPPIDDKRANRDAIAKGLLEFSKNISSSTQDFLPALAGAIPAGAEGFIGAKDDTENLKRKRTQDIMEKMFGIAKSEDSNDTRQQIADLRNETTLSRLEETIRHNQQTEALGGKKVDLSELLGLLRVGQGDRKLDQGDTVLKQGDRRLDITETQGDRRLDQGERGLDQKDTSIAETGRHNLETEADADARIAQAGERLKQQAANAALDAKKLNNEIADQALKSRKTAVEIDKITDDIKTNRLKQKATELRLDDPLFKITDPEGFNQAKTEFDAYSTELEKGLNQGKQAPSASSTLTPETGAAAPQVTHPKEAPARVTSRADFDALPPGSYFINPKDGKLMRKKANGGQ